MTQLKKNNASVFNFVILTIKIYYNITMQFLLIVLNEEGIDT